MIFSVGAAVAFARINCLGSTLVLYNNALQAEKIEHKARAYFMRICVLEVLKKKE